MRLPFKFSILRAISYGVPTGSRFFGKKSLGGASEGNAYEKRGPGLWPDPPYPKTIYVNSNKEYFKYRQSPPDFKIFFQGFDYGKKC